MIFPYCNYSGSLWYEEEGRIRIHLFKKALVLPINIYILMTETVTKTRQHMAIE